MINVTLIQRFEEFLELTAAAEHLIDPSNPSAMFAHPSFYRAYWSVYGSNLEVFALLVREDDQVAGLLPLVAKKTDAASSKRLRLEILGANVCDFTYFPGCEDAQVIDAIKGFLAGRRDLWSVVQYPFIRDGARMLETSQATSHGHGLHLHTMRSDVNYVLDLTSGTVQHASGFNRTMRNQIRRLRQVSDFALFTHRDPASVVARLPHLMHMHILRWSGTDQPSKFLAQRSRQFYYRLIEEIGARGVVLFELRWAERSIAYVFGFTRGRRHLLYTQTYDRTLQRYSPGKLLNTLLIQQLLEDHSWDYIDYMRGDEGYKQSITDRLVPLWEVRWYARKIDCWTRRLVVVSRRWARRVILCSSTLQKLESRIRGLLDSRRRPSITEIGPGGRTASGDVTASRLTLRESMAPPSSESILRWQHMEAAECPTILSFFGAFDGSPMHRVLQRLWNKSWAGTALMVNGNVLAFSMYKTCDGEGRERTGDSQTAISMTCLLWPALTPVWSDQDTQRRTLAGLAEHVARVTDPNALVLLSMDSQTLPQGLSLDDSPLASTEQERIPREIRAEAAEFLALRFR